MICKKCANPNHIVCSLDLNCKCCEETFKKMEYENPKIFKLLKQKIIREKHENIPRHGWCHLQLGNSIRIRNKKTS